MIKFQYISDLHLEHYSFIIKIKKLEDCDNLFLLGDIGYAYSQIYHDFIKYCSNKWKNVFVIYGNHEYYCGVSKYKTIKTMEEIENETKKFPSNVYFLNNSYILINKRTSEVKYLLEREDHSDDFIKIIGTTLWSNINQVAAKNMNDYNFIYTSPTTKLTPDETRSFFRMSKEYIIQEILMDTFPVILLTHHGVNELCNGAYQGNFMSSGYVSDIQELNQFPNLIACINGHTHVSINTVIPNTSIKLLSNCFGYKGEKKSIVQFDPDSFLEIN